MPSEKYNNLIEMIDLKSIEVYSLTCEQDNELKKTGNKKIDINLTHNVEKVMVEGFNLLVRIEFDVKAIEAREAAKTEELKPDVLFNINLHLDLKYGLEMEDEDLFLKDFEAELNEFVKNNALINAWPYVRETISSLTVRMGFPSLIIPTYKYTPKY